MTQQMSKWTKKQAGVIYRAHKADELTISAETISRVYDLVNDGDEIDYNGELNREIAMLKSIVDHIFNGEMDEAQAIVDRIEGKANVEDTADETADENSDETYTTTTGITYRYEESWDGFTVYEAGDDEGEEIEGVDSEAELFAWLEKMNEWRRVA